MEAANSGSHFGHKEILLSSSQRLKSH